MVGLHEIKEALRNEPSLTHYASVDIAAFFDNLDLRGASHLLPIDRTVMENTLCVKSTISNVEHGKHATRNGVHDDAAVCRPLALPQGAASSPLIAYWLLEQAFPAQDLEHSFPYADDLLILGESEEDVAAKVSRYESNLVGHPAGPLRLGPVECDEVSREGGFDFLGVRFLVRDTDAGAFRVVRSEVSLANAQAFSVKLVEKLRYDVEVRDLTLATTCNYLSDFLASMPTDDHEQLVGIACDAARDLGLGGISLLTAAARFLRRHEIERLSARCAA